MNTPTGNRQKSAEKLAIVIIGAGYAGLMTALRLAGKDKGRRTEVTLINPEAVFVERIRNHQFAVHPRAYHHPIRHMLGNRPIRFLQATVTGIDPERRVVTVHSDGTTHEVRYDRLVCAAGSITGGRTIPGVSQHTCNVATADEAARLRPALHALPSGSRVAVIGGGLSGIETAAEIAETLPHLRVMLITAGEFGEHLSPGGRAYLHDTFRLLQVEVRAQVRVQCVEQDALIVSAEGEQDKRIPFDLTVWTGALEAAPLVRTAGLPVNAKGQILLDPCLRSQTYPDIYGAGDCATTPEEVEVPLRMACSVAQAMGAHVADNVLASLDGRPLQPFQFGYPWQCISLGRRRGLIQFVRRDDTPNRHVLTAFGGSVFKELICRYAYRAFALERMFPGFYFWLSPGRKS